MVINQILVVVLSILNTESDNVMVINQFFGSGPAGTNTEFDNDIMIVDQFLVVVLSVLNTESDNDMMIIDQF